MSLSEIMGLDLWQVRRLAAQLEIDARVNEIMAKGHGAGAVRDLIRLKNEELSSDA
ncbi:MAG: hypothetical protein ABFE07_04815 [Armatimonadia bacterium]